MKQIGVIRNHNYTDHIYEYQIKRIMDSGEIRWFINYDINYKDLDKKDGPAIRNCLDCKNNKCDCKNNKCCSCHLCSFFYKRHFYINGNHYIVQDFADLTNHIMCNFCMDFCKQECFLLFPI